MVDLSRLSQAEKQELLLLLEMKDKHKQENRLLSYGPYPKQREFHKAGATNSERLLIAGNQLGKAMKIDEPVLTPNGWVEIGSLKVGDCVIAGDGSVTEVTGVYPQGIVPLYRLSFDQGSSVVCCENHLWQVTLAAHRYATRVSHGKTEPNPNFGRQTVVDTKYLIDRYKKAINPKQRVVVPHVGPIEFDHKEVPVDPYLLGALLGDGCLRNGTVSITTADDEIVQFVKEAIPEDVEAVSSGKYGWMIRSRLPSISNKDTGRFELRNSLKKSLIDIGVYGLLAHEKHVPPEYLINSPEVRISVLRGLMDTDGSVDRNGTIEFCSTSKQLAEDVAFLVRSFGGKVRINTRTTRFTDKNGNKKDGRLSYRLWIRCPHVVPVRLSRKVERLVRPASTCDEHVLHNIERVDDGEAVCISVAHPSKLYVTKDFIVTHNSVAGAAEWATHLTGRYPDWWEGAVFDKPVTMWASGVTSEGTRDNPQRLLVGPPSVEEAWGTGMIPKDALIGWSRAMGVANLLDNITVRWGGGGDVQAGTSILGFKSYEKGREKWQGPTLDGVWFDEECPLDIYTEGLTRTNNGQRGQFTIMTFTPLLGMSDVVGLFLQPGAK